MEIALTAEDRGRIEESIRQKFIKVASTPEGQFQYPTGRAGLEALTYDKEKVQKLPDEAITSYCGVGNPFTLGPIQKGEAVLDIGCGVGADTLIAADMVGPEGKVVGIDMIPAMLKRAKENLQRTDFKNVTFMEASAEKLPFPNEDFDVVISNGVFNLIPGKVKALSEVYRVLKPGGRMMIADQILMGELPEDTKTRVESWFR